MSNIHERLLPQLETYNALYNYDFICISETSPDSSVAQSSEEVQINGYSLIKPNHPSDSKRGSVCLYYKESLAVEVIHLTGPSECILYEVSIENCKAFIAVVYRSSSQRNDQFDKSLSSLHDLINEITLSNSLFLYNSWAF